MNAFKKFETCKYNVKNVRCELLRHNVGVNGYSIEHHCGKCKGYVEK